MKIAFRWLAWFSFFTMSIVMLGALTGALLFPAVGKLLQIDAPFTKLAWNGLHQLGFLALVWAPGTAFVLCLMKGYGESREKNPV